MLSSPSIQLDTNLCCELLYNVAWKFRLANVGKRRMFDSSSLSKNLPTVSQDTQTLLLLHYKWFTKYSLPLICQITETGNHK